MSIRFKHIFFDLDGTLNDSAPGITRSMQYALEKLEQPVPSEADLQWVVGPPIADNFKRLLQTEDEAVIKKGISIFRERYEPIGKFESTVYPGIIELLADLNDIACLRILTSKLEDFAKQIAEHFKLAPYFQSIHGTQAHESKSKGERFKELIERFALNPADCVLIGDRSYDINAAQENNVYAIAVTYGYGDAQEIAGANAFADTAADIKLRLQEA